MDDYEADLLDFFIVHHLAARHGYSRSQVLAHDKGLADASDEYIGFPTDRHG